MNCVELNIYYEGFSYKVYARILESGEIQFSLYNNNAKENTSKEKGDSTEIPKGLIKFIEKLNSQEYSEEIRNNIKTHQEYVINYINNLFNNRTVKAQNYFSLDRINETIKYIDLLSDEYIKGVLNYEEVNRISSAKSVVLNSLNGLRQDINPIYNITKADLLLNNKDSEKSYLSYSKNVNMIINNLINSINNISIKHGGSFSTEMFSYAFAIKESSSIMETAYIIKNVISNLSKNYATMLDNIYEIVNTSLNKNAQFTNVLNKINYLLSVKVDNKNYKQVLDELKDLIDTYNYTEIHNLLGDLYKVYDYIQVMYNLFESFIKSDHLNNPDLENNTDTEKLKEMDYYILSQYKNNIDKDLALINKAILNDLSKIVTFIKDVEVLIENMEAKNVQMSGSKELKQEDVKRILSLSNYNNIYKDLDILDEYGQTFDQTALSQLTGIKLIFNKYTYEIKRANQKELEDIQKEYERFSKIFGSDFEKVMYGLFEKKNGIRTGYLINKYDFKNSSMRGTKSLLRAEDDFRKSGLNSDMKALWESLEANTNIGNTMKKVIDSGILDDYLGIDKLLMITDIVHLFTLEEEALSDDINKRNQLYQFILNFSNIHYQNKTQKKLSDYLIINNSNKNNISVINYLSLIENKINSYINKLSTILDGNGERIFTDEYLSTMKEHMQNNINMLSNYFHTKYMNLSTMSIEDISLLDFTKILNSFMQVYDREDIVGYINYLYKETTALQAPKNNTFEMGYKKSQFNKFYLFNVGFGLNPPKDISKKQYTKEYEDYLKLHNNQKALEELYDYIYGSLLDIHHETGMINQYSMFDNKLFAFEASISETEKLTKNGISKLIKSNLYDIIHTNANNMHKIYLENGDAILPSYMPNKLSLTEDMLSKNIFLNLINATILKNKNVIGNKIIADAKSHVIALKNYVSHTPNSTKPLERTINKIVSKAKYMLGETSEDMFEKPTVEIKESGFKKIVTKLGKGYGEELQFEHVLNDLEKNFFTSLSNRKYKGFQQIQNVYGVRKQNVNPKKYNVSFNEINEFFKQIITIYDEYKKNNNRLAKHFENQNKYLTHIILHYIQKNSIIQNSLSNFIGRPDLYNLSTIEFAKYFTDWFSKNVVTETPFSPNDTVYENIDVRNDDMKDFFIKSYITINGVKVELDTEETSFLFNGKNNNVKNVNTNFTPLTVEDLERVAINIFADISYTEATEVSKMIEMEKERTEANLKIMHVDKVVNKITTLTAETTLNLNIMTFVAEMSYGLFGLLGLAMSSNKYGMVDVLTSLGSGVGKTVSSYTVNNKKLNALLNLLNRSDYVSTLPKNSKLYELITKKHLLDRWSEKYKNFSQFAGILPSLLYRNTVLSLVASKFNVSVNVNGVEKIINILDCFGSDGQLLYEIDDIYLARFIMSFDDVLKQISLYNNDYIEISKYSLGRAITTFKTFIFNLLELYLGRDKYIVGDDEYRRGIVMSLFGKGGLFLDSKRKISINNVINNLLSVMGNKKGNMRYQSDVTNVKKFSSQLFIIMSLYLILTSIEHEIYEDKDYEITDEEGNVYRGKRRVRRKNGNKDKWTTYALLKRIYRENTFLYDSQSSLGFLAQFGLPQSTYILNYFNLAQNYFTQDVYTTGIYKGRYKWEINLMKTHYLTNAYLRISNLEKEANR